MIRSRSACAAVLVLSVNGEVLAAAPPDVDAGRAVKIGSVAANAPGRRISVRLESVTLRAALDHWSALAGERIEPLWVGGRHADGLDPDRLVTLEAEGTPIHVLEAILAAVDAGDGWGLTWQRSQTGVRVGPRSRLNAFREVRVYDVADLIRDTPEFSPAPAVDLQSALSGQGGSVLSGGSEEGRVRDVPEAERAEELRELILEMIEPDQWDENGGDGGTLRVYGRSLIVNAPGYIHRQLAGTPRAY